MRLLLVSHAFPPHSSGGVEVCTAYLALALQQRGHDVHVLYRVAEPERPEYEVRQGQWKGLPVTTINNTFAQVTGFEMTYRNRAIEEILAERLERLGPDLVHFQHLTCLSTGLVEVAKRQGKATVLTLHDYWLVCQRGQMLQPDLSLCAEPEDAKCARCLAPYIYPQLRPAIAPVLRAAQSSRGPAGPVAKAATGLYHRFGPKADHERAVDLMGQRTRHAHEVMGQVDLLITPSRFHRSQFVRYGVNPDRIVALDNGLRTEPFRDLGHVPDNRVRFGFLGSVIPSKGVHLLVDAFGGIKDEGVTLDIYGWVPQYEGYPNYLEGLKERADARVRFHGQYDNADVGEILARTDVVVIPSIWYESASMIAHEAFLARVPVIATRLGALAEFVNHEVNGLLFEPRNTADLRSQMERLATDPELRQKLGQNPGPVKTIEQQAGELEEIYQGLVEANRSTAQEKANPAAGSER